MIDIACPNIRQIRIDVPLQTATAYLFCSPADAARRSQWWVDLYEYLLAFSLRGLHWQFDPHQGKYWARPALDEGDRLAIGARLRTASPDEVAGHRTLRIAVALNAERLRRLDLMYFAGESVIPE